MPTKNWTGGAPKVTDVWTLTVANTWAANDHAYVDFGVFRLDLTVGTATTTADVASQIVDMINATSATENPTVGANYVRNFGGQEVIPFQEVTAELSGSTVIIRATEAGNPIPITCSESTAGTGTLTAAHTVSATGPTFADNPDNYASGSLPVDDDTLEFDRGAVSMTDGLTYFKTGAIDLNYLFSDDWTGTCGRPAWNPRGYPEQRTRYLQCRGGGKTISLIAGNLGNTNGGKLFLDLTDQAGMTINLLAARNSNLGEPSVYILGTDASGGHATVTVKAGRVVFEPIDGPTTSGKEFFADQWVIGQPGNGSSPIVELSPLVRHTAQVATTITQYSGTLYSNSELFNSGTTNYVSVTVAGGEFVHQHAGDINLIEVQNGGKLTFRTPNSAAVNLNDKINVLDGGTLDLAGCPQLTIDTGGEVNMYPGSTLNYPTENGLTLVGYPGGSPAGVSGALPPNRRWDLSAAL